MNFHERIFEQRAWSGAPHTPEGADLENALLGKASVAPTEKIDYLPFAEAVQFAKDHQPELTSRSKELITLRNKVAESAANKDEPVRFFTAVGTPLDVYHGVDGFFEQNGRIATVDVSMREKEDFKADVLLSARLDEEGHVSVSDRELSEAANQVAAKLDGKIH